MAIWGTDRESLKKIHAAIPGNFGAQDQGVSAGDVRKFQQRLQGDEKSVDIRIYPDAGHGFSKISTARASIARRTQRILGNAQLTSLLPL
jgi:dienelactone hydrolase